MEIWKIININSDYMISNYGNVKSLERTVGAKGNSTKVIKETILKPSIVRGYRCVNIYKEGNIKNLKVSRCVAVHFIENPSNYKVVNHLDGNKMNDHENNLEWCSYSDNILHAYKIGLRNNISPIIQSYLNGRIIKEWQSISEASKSGFTGPNIHMVCNGKRKSHKGFKWSYKN